MNLRAAFLETFSSPIGIFIAASVLAAPIAIFKGDEIAESVKPIKAALSEVYKFVHSSEKKDVVVKPIEKPAADNSGLRAYAPEPVVK
jgi:hypothetical protein